MQHMFLGALFWAQREGSASSGIIARGAGIEAAGLCALRPRLS